MAKRSNTALRLRQQHFWARVDIGSPDECWLWRGARRTKRGGYGVFAVRTCPTTGAHRFAFYFANGQWPPVVRHLCHNPPCCNPMHLAGGTAADNGADTAARNRIARGESIGICKLTESDVLEIRRLYTPHRRFTTTRLAAIHGVSDSCIFDIVHRVTWRHVKGPVKLPALLRGRRARLQSR